MTNFFKPFTALVLVLALATVACGGTDETNTGAGDDLPTTDQPDTDLPAGDDTGDGTDDSDTSAVIPPSDAVVIGSANIGGEIVDPRPHEILSFVIAESYPEQVQITFVAGDVNCLAATATASATGQSVIVSLETGITTDALAKSCLAGEFEHTLSIALEEGLDGRDVVLADVPREEGVEATAPPAPPFEETLVGMNEAAAQEGAESFGYTWRVMQRDGEDFVGTTDYSESRINVAITDGVITRAWIG
ncbi:MAG: hypothetical protein EX269_16710 [Acidimicrobiales bacterium]|nr:MAG: hypothetical protein EX269_16710 [Acidimicrobiales bacterium]